MFEFYYTKVFAGGQGDSFGWLWKVLPIFTLLLGIGVQRFLTLRDQRKEERKAATDFVTEVRLTEEPARKQLEQIDKFIATQSVRRITVPELTAHRGLNLERLKSHDRSSVVEHFTRRIGDRTQALKLTNKLFSGCDLLTGFYHRIEELFKEYCRRGTECEDAYQRLLNEWMRAAGSIVVGVEKTGGDPNKDAFVVGLVKLMRLASDNADKDLYFFLDELHVPHIMLTAEYRKDDRIMEVAELNAKARFAILGLDSLRQEMVTKFQYLREDIGNESSNLLKAAEELDATPANR